jgi:hypothetical protein
MNKSNQTELVQFVRVTRGNKKGQARGVVVAIKDETVGYKLGWSFTKVNAGDVFDKEFGLNLARGRAEAGHWKATVPTSVLPIIISMRERAERYFKTA